MIANSCNKLVHFFLIGTTIIKIQNTHQMSSILVYKFINKSVSKMAILNQFYNLDKKIMKTEDKSYDNTNRCQDAGFPRDIYVSSRDNYHRYRDINNGFTVEV